MKMQIRLLFLLAVAALGAGWLGLRRHNAELESRLAHPEARP